MGVCKRLLEATCDPKSEAEERLQRRKLCTIRSVANVIINDAEATEALRRSVEVQFEIAATKEWVVVESTLRKELWQRCAVCS